MDQIPEQIERYIQAYNAMDVDHMLGELDSLIEFRNIADGTVTDRASGIDEFERIARQSLQLFSARKQDILNVECFNDTTILQISFSGRLLVDFSETLKKGMSLRLTGSSILRTKDSKIVQIIDVTG